MPTNHKQEVEMEEIKREEEQDAEEDNLADMMDKQNLADNVGNLRSPRTKVD